MKKIQFTYNSGIMIGKIQDSILIITNCYDSPFNYDALIKNALQDVLRNSEIIDVYIDMLSCVGATKQRFSKIIYNSEYNSFDFSSFRNISQDCLPRAIKNRLKRFYLKEKTSITNNSLLSEHQRYEMLQAG